MATILGTNVPLPEFNVSGFFANTWVYVLIIGLVGIILIIGLLMFVFFKAYNRRVVIFENVSGLGYQVALKTRARVLKLGAGGEEILKTLAGGHYLSSYGKKMGLNTYWYAKGSDGYLYNIILGDLDTKLGMLDIEPIDRDVRMFYVAVDRMAESTYGKTGFLEKYGIHLMLFVFLIAMIIGFWLIAGKINKGLEISAEAIKSTASERTAAAEAQRKQLEALNNILGNPTSGIIPAEGGT